MSADPDEPQSEGELIRMTYRMVRDLKDCKDDHENRIRKLEGFYAYVLGAAAIIAFSIPMAWDRIKTMFGGS